MINLWRCPVPGCGEELDSIGPVSLQLEISKHYSYMHPDIDALTEKLKAIPHTWQCSVVSCPAPNVSRSDETMLDLAIIGHNRFYHEKPEPLIGQPVTPQYVQEAKDVYVPMHGGMGKEDIKFLRDFKVIW
jgi:hypothetical protein